MQPTLQDLIETFEFELANLLAMKRNGEEIESSDLGRLLGLKSIIKSRLDDLYNEVVK